MIAQKNHWQRRWSLLAVGLCLFVSIATLTQFRHAESGEPVTQQKEPGTEPYSAQSPDTGSQQNIDLRFKLTLPEGLSPEKIHLHASTFGTRQSGNQYESFSNRPFALSFNRSGEPIWRNELNRKNESPSLKAGDVVQILGHGLAVGMKSWNVLPFRYTVTEEPVQEIEIIVQKAHTVQVRLVDENTGKPISDICVVYSKYNAKDQSGQTWVSSANADQQGNVWFPATGNQVQIHIGDSFEESGELYERYNPTLTLDTEAEGTQVFELKLPTPFTIRVLCEDGTPAINAHVTFGLLEPPYRTKHYNSLSNVKGILFFSDSPDKAFVKAYHTLPVSPGVPDSPIAAQNIIYRLKEKLPPGNELVLQLQKACQLKGRILDKKTKQPSNSYFITEATPGSQTTPKIINRQEGMLANNLFPGVRYTLSTKGEEMTQGKVKVTEKIVREFQFVAPGEELDLGDIYVEP